VLTWLSIQGLALVESVELELDPGLNVLTGETGAGKSLVLGSIGLLLGERADGAWLRSGERRGSVEAVLDLSGRPDLIDALRALDVEPEEGRVVLRREIHADGKGRALVNGRAVLLAQLRAVGEILVDLHGQHEHQLLLRPERQADFFDSWSGLLPERRALEAERTALAAERRELRASRERWERDRAEESTLREDLEELRGARLEERDEEGLKRERERLHNRDRLVRGYAEAREGIASEERGAMETLRRAARALKAAAALDPSAAPLLEEMERCQESLRELEDRLESEEAKLLEEPLDLESLEERLAQIHRLKRKHRTDLPGLVALRDSLAERARDLDPSGTDLSRSEREHEERLHAYERRLDAFLEHRSDRFAAFEHEVGARLSKLNLGKSALRLRAAESDRARAAVDPAAIPTLEFAFQPNPGESERPLRRIASGGELSRIMLAIKSLMAERDQVAVLVFDEVDQGIGGAVGEEVGKLLRTLGARRQVLCITHLPLIAAYGARHFEVGKSVRGGRTSVSVRALAPEEREHEVARLLAGDRASEVTRRQARELLQGAHADAATSEAAPAPRASRRRAAARGA
jgi:DNA repair protein RecN (Recombination protein N)